MTREIDELRPPAELKRLERCRDIRDKVRAMPHMHDLPPNLLPGLLRLLGVTTTGFDPQDWELDALEKWVNDHEEKTRKEKWKRRSRK